MNEETLEGPINIDLVVTDDKRVGVNFQASIRSLALTPEDARNLGVKLIEQAALADLLAESAPAALAERSDDTGAN